jgi:antitoxin component YwqK of YwqJK toxin-antitoxin module
LLLKFGIIQTILCLACIDISAALVCINEINGFPAGPVKEIESTLNSSTGEAISGSRFMFNPEGFLAEAIVYGNDWIVSGKFTWNEKGDIVESIFYKNGVFSYKQIDKYDGSPALNYRLILWSEEDYGVCFYSYIQKGYSIEHAIYDENDDLVYKEEFDRNTDGDVIEQRQYNPDNKLAFQMLTSYISPGKILEETLYERGEITHHTINQYNAAKEIKESLTQDFTDLETTLITVNYDNHGIRIEELIYQNDMLFTRYTYSYSPLKEVIRTEWNKDEKMVSRTGEIFDDNGNVIIRKYYSINDNSCTVQFYESQRGFIKEESWKNDRLISTYEKIYDSEDKIIRIERRDESGDVDVLTAYVYDQYGNMMKSGANRVWQYVYYDSGCSNWSLY